jgi:hypothetical protein
VSSARGPEKLLGDQLAADRAARAEASGEQLGLELGEAERAAADALPDLSDSESHLALPDASEIEEIQRELDCDVYAAVREHRRRSGAGGRKLGSGNRRNAEFRAFMLSLGPHPGAVLARIYGQPVDVLAASLGCSKEAALDKIIRAADIALPFLEGKMPATLNLRVKGDFSLIAGAGTGLFDGIEDADYDELPELGFSSPDQGDSGAQGGASE